MSKVLVLWYQVNTKVRENVHVCSVHAVRCEQSNAFLDQSACPNVVLM